MKADSETLELNSLKIEHQKLKAAFEIRGDFIEWLFENEITESMALMWDKFETETTSEELTLNKEK